MRGNLENTMSEAPTIKEFFYRQAAVLGYVDQIKDAYRAVTADLYGKELDSLSEEKRKSLLSTYCNALKEAKSIIQFGKSLDDALGMYLEIRDRIKHLPEQAENLKYVKLHCNALAAVRIFLENGRNIDEIGDAIGIISKAHEKDIIRFYACKFTKPFFDYAVKLLDSAPGERVASQKQAMWKAYAKALGETREALLGIGGSNAEKRLSASIEAKIGMLSGQMKNLAEPPVRDVRRRCWSILNLQLSRLAWKTVKELIDSGAERRDLASVIEEMGKAWKC